MNGMKRIAPNSALAPGSGTGSFAVSMRPPRRLELSNSATLGGLGAVDRRHAVYNPEIPPPTTATSTEVLMHPPVNSLEKVLPYCHVTHVRSRTIPRRL